MEERLSITEDSQRKISVYEAPDDSPWGKIQTCKTLCPGAYSVNTAGHGGVMVHRELAEKEFRPEAQACGFMAGVWLCYEEDCDAQVALRELMDKKLYQAPVNRYFGPGEYEAVINSYVQVFHPEYWNRRAQQVEHSQAGRTGAAGTGELTTEDIVAEGNRILQELRMLDRPNSPHGTHFMVRIAPEFIARVGFKDINQLMYLLPFRSTVFTGLKGIPGIYVTILPGENRSKELRLSRSMREQDTNKTESARRRQRER